MNTKTGQTVSTIKMTGHGSDRYGPCEACGQHMSEAALWERHAVYQHVDGYAYLNPMSATWAHKECCPSTLIDKTTLTRRGKLLEYPRNAEGGVAGVGQMV